MKRVFLLWMLLLGAAGSASASVWGDFAGLANRGNVKAYARDLGGILGSGTFQTARGLGFAGFDVGFHAAYQTSPSRGNSILKGSGKKFFGMPWIQAEIGLPLKFDGFIRGFSWDGLTMSGGGLRYSLLKIQDRPLVPQVLLAADGEAFTHEDFGGTHFGLSAVASFSYKAIRPYAGVGGDRTRLSVKRATSDPAIVDESFVKYGYRADIGVTIRAIPFTYFNLAAAVRNGELGAEGGFGLRF